MKYLAIPQPDLAFGCSLRLNWCLLVLLILGAESATAAQHTLANARALRQKGDMVSAREEFVTVANQAERAKDQATLVESLDTLSQMDLSAGRYKDSLAESEHAIKLIIASPKPNQVVLARAYNTFAQGRFYTGDTADALKHFELALQFSRSGGDRQLEIGTLNNIGNVYYALGRYGDAFHSYREAENILQSLAAMPWYKSRLQLTRTNLAVLYQRIGQYGQALQLYAAMSSETSLPPVERAQMFANAGTLYRRLGDPVTALEKYRAADQIYRRTTLRAGEIGVLNNIGILQAMDLRDFPASIASFTEAERLSRDSGAKRLTMPALLYRAEALLRDGELGKSRADFQAASAFASELHADEEAWRAEYGLARIAAADGNSTLCTELLRHSLQVIERMRAASTQTRTGFLVERRDVYDLLLHQYSANPNPNLQEIYQLMERSRSRQLQDRLQSPPIGLEELRKRLSPDTVLLDYWTDGQSIVLLTIAASGVQIQRQPLPSGFNEKVAALQTELANPASTGWRSLATDFGNILLSGVEPILRAGTRNIIVVPDGELGRVPFEALPIAGRDGLLIEHATVSYLPFASAYRPKARKSRGIHPPWTDTLRAFANPAPGPGASLPMDGPGALPNAEVEIRRAADAVRGRADLRIGPNAKRAVLFEAAAQPVLLHFATHAYADPESPDRSWILFAGNAQSSRFEYLFLSEAASLRLLPSSMVTVSACDSGKGRSTRGDGIQNFASAFLAAGAQTVVTSLWRVGDRSSAELMERFYESLGDGESASAALRSAKLKMLRSRTGSHPAYWAGFVLAGNGEALAPYVVSWRLFVLGLLVVAVVVWLITRSVIKRQGGTE